MKKMAKSWGIWVDGVRHEGAPLAPPTPILEGLEAKGIVWMEDGKYVGRASDGVVVDLGYAGYREEVERYLNDHPTPDTW